MITMKNVKRGWRVLINRETLSRRIVFVYSAIILIPLIAIFVIILGYYRNKVISSLQDVATISVEEHVRPVMDKNQNVALINGMVVADQRLKLFLTIADNFVEEELIENLKAESDVLERILSVVPSIYSIRIFTTSDKIPERFPVFLHKNRTDLESLKPIEYNYSADFMANLSGLMEPSVCFTSPITNGKREIAYLQVSMEMKDYFPFLYEEAAEYQNDFVFYIDVNEETDEVKLNPIFNDETLKYNPLPERREISKLQKNIEKKLIQIKEKNALLPIGDIVEEKVISNTMGLYFGPRKYVASWSYIPEQNLVIAHTCSTRIMSSEVAVIMLIAMVALVVSSFGLFSLIQYATSKMLKGVYTLMDGMKKVSNGNLNVNIPETKEGDVGEALRAFNIMTNQLQAQIEQIKREQQLIADTEMKAMQNQINAHFLYNVLETIHMQAVLADNDEIAESILVLGKMMRYCLRWRVHSVTLSQEVEYINSYIYILNIRNDYVITLKTDIPEQYENFMIPKMMIQPFVENAFFHAIEPVAQDAVIKIGAEVDEENGKLWLIVQDFGKGIKKEKVNEINEYLNNIGYERDSTGSIGIKNIQQRLNIFYGENYRLQIVSEEGKGTTIRIPLPLKDVSK